ncbi:hypothetical protein SynA1560_01421 [Synechococcus sp. A15-60]|nr:hypothetical protein SynA1560_01421 [Synechococcus sp. A15-60]
MEGPFSPPFNAGISKVQACDYRVLPWCSTGRMATKSSR